MHLHEDGEAVTNQNEAQFQYGHNPHIVRARDYFDYLDDNIQRASDQREHNLKRNREYASNNKSDSDTIINDGRSYPVDDDDAACCLDYGKPDSESGSNCLCHPEHASSVLKRLSDIITAFYADITCPNCHKQTYSYSESDHDNHTGCHICTSCNYHD